MVQPCRKIAHNIYSHSVTKEQFEKLWDTYSRSMYPQVTSLVTRYYNQDLILSVTKQLDTGKLSMNCHKTYHNYSSRCPEIGLEFYRDQTVPLSISKFEVHKKMNHVRQALVGMIKHDQLLVEFEVLYKSVLADRSGATVYLPGAEEDVLSRSYRFYFKGQPDTMFVAKHISHMIPK